LYKQELLLPITVDKTAYCFQTQILIWRITDVVPSCKFCESLFIVFGKI